MSDHCNSTSVNVMQHKQHLSSGIRRRSFNDRTHKFRSNILLPTLQFKNEKEACSTQNLKSRKVNIDYSGCGNIYYSTSGTRPRVAVALSGD
jgi:hypothetical protein